LEHANQGKFYDLLEKANETMSKIKQAQGQYVIALEYADTALKLKNNLLDQQLQKISLTNVSNSICKTRLIN